MKTWEDVLLRIINHRCGTASTTQIYTALESDDLIKLTEEQLRDTIYGGRPAYQHEVRSFLVNLVKKGDLRRENRGTYSLTDQGKCRISK